MYPSFTPASGNSRANSGDIFPVSSKSSCNFSILTPETDIRSRALYDVRSRLRRYDCLMRLLTDRTRSAGVKLGIVVLILA